MYSLLHCHAEDRQADFLNLDWMAKGVFCLELYVSLSWAAVPTLEMFEKATCEGAPKLELFFKGAGMLTCAVFSYLTALGYRWATQTPLNVFWLFLA